VHYGQDFDNALWNGTQMIYGDGSGTIIAVGTLTKAVDVVAHEMTHGVTQSTAGLIYRGQSGALSESFSDVLGSLVKQYVLNQTADTADWLIGDGILGSALKGRALRSLRAPGNAFDLDRQPDHMRGYVNLPADNDPRNDNGGVHINSGIPNRAFYLVATTFGGHAWENAGQIWYQTLTDELHADSDFRAAAEASIDVARKLFGGASIEWRAVQAAWRVVGVL
jgi:Zn-dependent metalloprotease